MKKSIKFLLFSVILLGCVTFAQSVVAQAPPPPPPTEKGSNDNKGPGGGAPIDGGLVISLALVAGFGAWKTFNANKKKRAPNGN